MRAVEYCESEWECAEIGVGQGGGYGFGNATITIDRNFRFPPNGVFLTLAHEYGHALGLEHSKETLSIMRSGWDLPIAQGVSDADKEAGMNLKKIP